MHREWNEKALLNTSQKEWWSKLTDGVFSASVLFLTWFVVLISIRPIMRAYGNIGLLLFALVLLAVSMVSLQQSLIPRYTDATRAWYGMSGGSLAWAVAVISSLFGVPFTVNATNVVSLMMASLIIALLWKTGLPLGARFFSLTFLLHWAGLMLMNFHQGLASFSPIFAATYQASGYLAIIGVLVSLFWIFFKTRRRMQRVNCALALWMLLSLAMYVFLGQILMRTFSP